MWEDVFFDDGKSAESATMDDRFTEAKSWIDALTGNSSRRGAFNPAHAASPLDGKHGFAEYSVYGDDGVHRYTMAVFGANITYAGYGTDGGLPGSSTGWVVVGHPSHTLTYAGDAAHINYSTPVDVTTDEDVQAILVLANIEVHDADSDTDPADAASLEVAFCIQIKYNGTWRTVDTSERVIRIADLRIDRTSDEKVSFDVPLATLITREVIDLKGSYGSGITDIRAVHSFISPAAAQRVDLLRFNLSALPLRCKVV